MAFGTLVSAQSFSGAGGTLTGTLGWSPTAGNLIVIAWGWRNNSGGPNEVVTDTKGNSYTRAIRNNTSDFKAEVEIYFSQITTGGSSFSFTVQAGSTGAPVGQSAWVGEFTVDPGATVGLDNSSQAANSGTAPAISVTNNAPTALIVALAGDSSTSAAATVTDPSSPWAPIGAPITNATTALAGGAVYQLVSTSSSRTATWTTDSLTWAAVIATFTETTKIAVSDPNLFLSPGGWVVSGSAYAQTYCGGNYLKLGFTGTSVSLNVDVSPLSGAAANQYPVLTWCIDGTGWATPTQLTSGSSQIVLKTGLSAGTHQLELVYQGVNTAPSIDRWNASAAPYLAFRITGFLIDNGSASAAPSLRSKRAIFYGDSLTEGFDADSSPTGSATNNINGLYSWARLVAKALDAEYCIAAYGSGRLCTTAAGSINVVGLYPTAGVGTWDHLDSTHVRTSGGLFVTPYDYCLINIATNDNTISSDATIQGQTSGLLAALKSALPASAKTFVIVPFQHITNIASDLSGAAYGSGQYCIDLDALYTDDKFSLGFEVSSPSEYSADGVHPHLLGGAEAAARVVKAIQSLLGGGGGGGTTYHHGSLGRGPFSSG